MKPGFKAGITGELEWTVTADRTITLGGDPVATVFATPCMIQLMERAAREALRPFLDTGEESVGVDVNVQHLGAAPMGAQVRGVAIVTAVDRNKVAFEVEAWYGDRKIGEGRHQRAVIDLPRFLKRLKKDLGDATPTASAAAGEPPPSGKTVSIAVEGPVATVTLDRPASLNAVDRQMTSELERLIAWLGANPSIRIVVLTGAGRSFCAGDDVKELEDFSAEEARSLSHRQAQMYLGFERLPQVVIAAVNGPAIGAGCICAASCDFRIASHAAHFGMPEILLGWPPGYGVAQLTALVGKSRALDLCLSGRTITAREAQEWGLAHEAVPANRLLPRVREFARQLLALPAEALRETKRQIHADESPHAKVAYRMDTEAYVRCFDTPNAREGIRAFKQKRRPKFD